MAKLKVSLESRIQFYWNVDGDDGLFTSGASCILTGALPASLRHALVKICAESLRLTVGLPDDIAIEEGDPS